MNNAAIVRRGTAQDVDAVLQLAAASRDAPQWGRAVYQDIVEQSAQGGATRNAAVQRVLFVAESDQIDGCGVASILLGEAELELGEAELESVVVAADKQRQGLGKALCLAVMAWARESGAAQMRLEVRASNAGAQALYRRLGFVQVGRRLKYYREPWEDAVLMIVPLTSADL